MKSTYYIACHTKQQYDPGDYVVEAGKMANALQQVFGDRDKILAITKAASLDVCHSEVEIAHEAEGLVGKCVLDIEAATRVQIDKSKLSALLKATTNWPGMKIEKRAVIQPEPDVIQLEQEGS
jgi:hypothetical protein